MRGPTFGGVLGFFSCQAPSLPTSAPSPAALLQVEVLRRAHEDHAREADGEGHAEAEHAAPRVAAAEGLGRRRRAARAVRHPR